MNHIDDRDAIDHRAVSRRRFGVGAAIVLLIVLAAFAMIVGFVVSALRDPLFFGD